MLQRRLALREPRPRNCATRFSSFEISSTNRVGMLQLKDEELAKLQQKLGQPAQPPAPTPTPAPAETPLRRRSRPSLRRQRHRPRQRPPPPSSRNQRRPNSPSHPRRGASRGEALGSRLGHCALVLRAGCAAAPDPVVARCEAPPPPNRTSRSSGASLMPLAPAQRASRGWIESPSPRLCVRRARSGRYSPRRREWRAPAAQDREGP